MRFKDAITFLFLAITLYIIFIHINNKECVPLIATPDGTENLDVEQVSGGYTLSFPAKTNATYYIINTRGNPEGDIILNNVKIKTNSYFLRQDPGNGSDFNITAVNSCSSVFAGRGCFLAGSPVLLFDNTTKPIEEIKVGDFVIGAFGQVNKVEALSRPLLGNYDMISINDEHKSSFNHPHVTLDNKFCCMDVTEYNKNCNNVFQPVFDKTNNKIMMKMERVKGDELSQLNVGTVLKTSCGSKVVKNLYTFSMSSDTQLYNLVIDGNHTFHVNGYAVRGWKRDVN